MTAPPANPLRPLPTRDSGQGTGSAASNPLPGTPPLAADFPFTLPGLQPGGSVEAVLEKRLEQVRLGHTPADDLNLPIGMLLLEAQRYGTDARDWLARPAKDPVRAHYRGKLVSMAALVLAEIDRLDAVEGQP